MTGRPSTAEPGTPRSRGLFRNRLRDARIRSKLGLLLIIPLIAVVVLAAVRLVDSGQQALSAELVRSLALASAESSVVAHELHRERMAALRLLSDPDQASTSFNAQTARTDQVIDNYLRVRAELDNVPALIEERLALIDSQLDTVDGIRQDVLREGEVTVSAAALRYGVILNDIIDYQESLGQVTGDIELAESIRAVTALSKAKRHMAEAQTAAYLGLLDRSLVAGDISNFLIARTGQQESLLAFTLAANPAQIAIVNNGLTGDAMVAAERAADDIVRSVGGQQRIDADTADRVFGAVIQLVTSTEQRLHAEQVALATQLRDDVFQRVLIEALAVLLALAVTIVVAVLLARMLARSLGQLRANALAVAERELPETVARLSDPRTLGENTPEQLAAQVREPIQLHSRDEIGQVAQAFNVVHRAAVRVAAEQAALRTSVSAMFLNLARRSQSLVDRMISQLDEIERHEEDPKRLARMFVLDHLATRMRRNDENLLVLAGADSSPPRTDDALVADVLRAAQSEVEHYARIEFGTVDTDVSVISNAVNDVVRLAAELFDNATRFSPPDSAVVCEARRLGDHVIIQIEDRGVGMSPEQVNRLNAWLASPPTLEVSTFRKMGLAVVARLASRHQIRVELRCDPNYGTIAYVALPRNILVLPRSRMRNLEIPPPRSPMPVEAPPPSQQPPVPARHLGQIPRRPVEVAAPTASWDERTAVTETIGGNGQVHAGQLSETSRFELPVAGRAPYGSAAPMDQTAHSVAEPAPAPAPVPAAPPVAQPPMPEATVELPIFKEMEQVWFRSHGDIDLGRRTESRTSQWRREDSTYAGGHSAAASPEPARQQPVDYQPAPQPTTTESTESWRTAADFGWRAAAAAAQPTAGGATRSGLPKRVPQAQLVPGSVETPSPSTARRSPEEIRGLLSAYHRGVQRGRETGAR